MLVAGEIIGGREIFLIQISSYKKLVLSKRNCVTNPIIINKFKPDFIKKKL